MDLPDPVVLMQGTLPPIGAALLLVGLFGARWLPLAAAIGLFAAYSLLKEWPLLPHQLWTKPDGRQWLLWGVVTAALVAQLEHLRVLRGRVAVGFGIAVGIAGLWLMLVKLAARWDPAEVLLHVTAGALAVVVLLLACRRTVARAPANVVTAAVFTFVLSFDAVLLAVGRSGLFAQMCGAVAAALGAAAGTTLWRRSFALAVADGTWIAIAHALFVLVGVHLGELSWGAAACALAAPLPLLALKPTLAQRPATWLVAALLLTLPVLALAFWFAQGI